MPQPENLSAKPFDDKLSIPELEEQVGAFWETDHTFEKSLEQTKDGQPFTFYDGPPFATGLPHYGHILASTIKDVIPRYQTMRGHFVRRRWGWDCHGLPIEELVEKKLGISGKKQIEEIGIAKFNETCRDMVLTYAAEWGKMVSRLGRWVEFENAYKTMDRDYIESVWWGFKTIYEKGLVYEGRKVLLYCPRCETPLSNFEVAMDNSYKDVAEESVYVKFHLLPNQPYGAGKQTKDTAYLLAWTTTPWTLPGNVALAVGKDIAYTALRVAGQEGLYILASNLVKNVFGEAELEIVHEDIKGADLVGLAYEPLFDMSEMQSEKSYKVYAADFVTTEDGTGIVHTAVVYGEDDYQLGLREGLPVVPMLDEKGHFNDKAPELIRGQYFKKAEKAIKDDLEARGLLFKRAMYTHSYPHCWRCGTALFYNAIPAWFINVQQLKPGLLESNEKEMHWFPAHLKHGRYQKTLESAPDWNISRNRYWGNPIPVWKCKDCGENKVVGSTAELGTEVQDLHRPWIDEVVLKCEACGGEAHRVPEIFDSWIDAGSMPFAEYHYPFENKEVFEHRFPAQFVAEYIAQTRAWFQLLHVMNFALFGKAPVENLVTTGNILAEDGTKMSKSKMNYPDPWIVIEKYGVDTLRFYLMNSVVMQSDDMNFSLKDLELVHRKVTMLLMNVYQYFMTYASQKPKAETRVDDSHVLDRWINARTKELVIAVTDYLDAYDTVHATRTIEEYIDDLSTWYLRRSRGREDAGFFPTFYSALLTVAKILAPFMPHIAEVIHANLTAAFCEDPQTPASVHLAPWPQKEALTAEEQKLLKEMAAVREAASAGQALRKQLNIPAKKPLLAFGAPGAITSELAEILKEELNVKSVVQGSAGGDARELATEKGAYSFDITETPELKLEGLTRTLERFVQEMRKTQGFKVGERAILNYETASTDIEKAFAAFDTKKTYIERIEKSAAGAAAGETFKADGMEATVTIERA